MAGLQRLSLTDMTNLAVEAPDTPMHQGALGVLDGATLLDRDGSVRIEPIRRHIDARLNRIPELRRILFQTSPLQGRPMWVDDPAFRIVNHVLVARLPAPGGETQALGFAERQMSSLMDRSRPMWQLWFLEGYDREKVGIFLKLHHVFADGQAILKIIGLLFDLEPGIVETGPSGWAAAPRPRPRALVLDNIARKGRGVTRAARRAAHPVVVARSVAATGRGLLATLREGRGAPRTSLNRPIGPSRGAAAMRLSLADAKAVAHKSGVKVNDVFLNIVAGGLREVLLERGTAVRGVSIRASMAVAMQSSGADAHLGNHVGTMIVALPLDERDAAARLALIASATSAAKARQRATISQAFTVVLALSGLTRYFIRRQHLVNVLVTNLAGPPIPLYIAGARLEDAVAIPPIAGNVTVSFAALSYNGHLNISVHVEKAAWPDLDVLMSGMSETWSNLRGGVVTVPERAPSPGSIQVPVA